MKSKMKKLLSLLLVLCFALTMIPISGITASAEAATVSKVTGNGAAYSVTYNSDYVTMSETVNNGLLLTTTSGAGTSNTGISVTTETMYPILSSTFDVQCHFADNGATILFYKDINGKEFTIRLINYANRAILQTKDENGEYVKCADIAGCVSARTAFIGVAEVDGSYYLTYDGIAVTGADFDVSDAVKEALKLENTFSKTALENDAMFYFGFRTASLKGNAYIVPHVNYVGDGYAVEIGTQYGDRNTTDVTTIIKPTTATTASYADGVYTFNVALNTSVGLLTPIATTEAEGGFGADYDSYGNGYCDATYSFANSANGSALSSFGVFGDGTGLFQIKNASGKVQKCDGGTNNGSNTFIHYASPTFGAWKHVISHSGGARLWIQGPVGYQATNTYPNMNFANVLGEGKNVYLDISYTKDVTGVKINPGKTSESNVTLPDDATDLATVKTALDAFYADDSRYMGYTYDELVKATELLYAYEVGIIETAAAFDAKVDALPAIEDLLYQDKATVEALVAEYNGYSDEIKAEIKNYSSLETYLSAVENIEFNGYYRTSNGDLYKVDYDSANIEIGSDKNNGALTATLIGTGSAKGTDLGVITTEKFPIVSGKYQIQQYFGNLDASGRFGIAISDDEDIYHRVQNGRFALFRMESGDTNTFYVDIDGGAVPCYTVANTTRNRMWNIGVTKQNGSWYMTIDGNVVDGTGYSEAVQNAVKLENYFGEEFLANDGMVHFFMYAASMHGSAYLRPMTSIENGLIVSERDAYKDQNVVSNGVTYANADTTVENDGKDDVYTIDANAGTSVTFTSPINTNAFYIDIDSASGEDVVAYTFSNYVNNLSDSVSVTVNRDGVYCSLKYLGEKLAITGTAEHITSGTLFCDGGQYTSSHPGFWKHQIGTTNNAGIQINGPSAYGVEVISTAPDFSSILGDGKDVYLTITVNKPSKIKVKLGNNMPALSVTLPENAEDVDAAQTALDAFYADAARYTSYEAMVKATDLYNEIEARKMGAEVDERVAAIGVENKKQYSNHLDSLKVLASTYNMMTVAQRKYFSEDANVMMTYYNNLADASAINLTNLRKMLLGAIDEDIPAYDYCYDDELNILDLVRMKKAAVQGAAAPSYDSAVYTNVNYAPKMVYAHTYGAKGDGVTDDGPAVAAALTELKKSGAGSILVFEKNKTYNIASLPSNRDTRPAIFEVKNCAGLEIDGNGSTFILDDTAKDRTFGWFQNTKDCIVTDMTFDYKTSPAFNASYIDTDKDNLTITLKADRNIGLANSEIYSTASDTNNFYNFGNKWFGIVTDAVSRSHVYIESYEMISTSENTFKLKVLNESDYTKFIDEIKESGMICPMPRMGHRSGSTERGFTIVGNTNMEMRNIKIVEVCRFGMYVAQNEGIMKFINVDFTPADDLHYTSWRDAYHVINNRAKIIWDGCESHYNYDDVFNISSTALYFESYNEETRELDLKSSNGNYPEIQVGDTISVINASTGEDYGKTVVESIISQDEDKVIIKDALNIRTTGEKVYTYFTNCCAPDSEIINCDFSGTFRFRGPITITNTKFLNMRTWMNLESNIEGPVPQGIVFRNCTIESSYANSKIYIGGITNGADTEFDLGNRQFHTDITFENCTIDESSLVITSSDKNYVTIKGCTDTDGSAITDRN